MSCCGNCKSTDNQDILTFPYQDEIRRDGILIPKDVNLKAYIDMVGKSLQLGQHLRKILSVKVTEHHIHVEIEPLCK